MNSFFGKIRYWWIRFLGELDISESVLQYSCNNFKVFKDESCEIIIELLLELILELLNIGEFVS